MELSLAIAFAAGVVSVASPCVLPLIPGYLAYLSGASLKDARPVRGRVFLHGVFFVLGFSLVFSLLGVLLQTILESAAGDVRIWLSRIGGFFIIFFGLYVMDLVRIPFLEKGQRMRVHGITSWYSTSFLFGVSFAVGWTPCIGVVLGSIIGLAAAQPSSAFALLLAYSLGLGVPFLAVSLFLSAASRVIERYADAFRILRIIFGIILVLVGILVFTQELSRIASFPFLNWWLIS